ncbi:MAG TPA: hypothetical protein VK146_05940 [Tabrizicola sp.]|nr:hypothetical protein [Tabrizicola sp.]
MNMDLAMLWGQIGFGAVGAVLLILWGVTGQKSAALRIGGALCVLVAILLVVYTNYLR